MKRFVMVAAVVAAVPAAAQQEARPIGIILRSAARQTPSPKYPSQQHSRSSRAPLASSVSSDGLAMKGGSSAGFDREAPACLER